MLLVMVAVAGLLISPGSAGAWPRREATPWPDFAGRLFHERFSPASTDAIDPAIYSESWSGYALNRSCQLPGVQPWVIPMVVSNRFRIDPQAGAARFWYRPDNSGIPAGTTATLLTLVSGNGTSVVAWWSLVITPDNTLELLCQGDSGPVVCLSAPIVLQGGVWGLVAMGYSETNCALYWGTNLVAAGSGVPAVPPEAIPFTSLVVGSDLSGQSSSVACGQLEELTTFSGTTRFSQVTGHPFGINPAFDIAAYWNYYSPVAALGPVTDAEWAAQQQAREQRMAAQQANMLASPMDSGQSDGPGQDPFPCGTNYIYDVWLTNIVVWSNAQSGWNTSLSIGGGTNGAWYDLFSTTNLSGGSLTNMPWVWLGHWSACDTIVLTNQPGAAAFYILGTPLDSDGDGLTDAYELLISHSNPHLWDSGGDGISDGWKVALGLNPSLNNPAQSGERLNFTYYPDGGLSGVSGARSETTGLDFEWNVTGN